MTINIDGRQIGQSHPCFIIAELSANHNNDLERAKRIVETAALCGADAIKLQTYKPDSLTIQCDKPNFRVDGTIWEGRSLYELYQQAALPWAWHEPLFSLAKDLGLIAFSTPFDFQAVHFLEQLNVPAYKIASSELVDLPLIKLVAKQGKPIILSTGMADLQEIDEAVKTARSAGCKELILLKCTAAYPAPIEAANLVTIPDMAERFNVIAGLSDHTFGNISAVVATVLGGKVLEKHLTLSRADGGPDAEFSMEPKEFSSMVKAVRETEKALGQVQYMPTDKELRSRDFRRSLFVVANMKKGDEFTPNNIRSIRPATGMHTRHYEEVLGQISSCDITAGTPLERSHLGSVAKQ